VTTLHDSRHCGANKRQGEGTCTRPAGWGTPHPGYGPCKLHGGSSSSVDGIVVDQQVRRLLADLGVSEPVANPLLELQRLAGEIIAFKDALRSMVERLNSVRYDGPIGEQIRGEIVVYERALDRSARVLRDITALRIDERLVEIQSRVNEAQGYAVAGTIRAILDDLELTPQQQAHVGEVVPRRLRELSADAPGAARSFTEPRRLTLEDFDRELELMRAERDALPAPGSPRVEGWPGRGGFDDEPGAES
jgi:hypothetical protein